MDSESVPSSLGKIVPILRVANEVEPSNSRVAYLCRLYAFMQARIVSSDPDIHSFKSALLRHLEREEEALFITERYRKSDDVSEMQSVYKHYYGEYTQLLDNADNADRSHLIKAYETVTVLFEVLKAASLAESNKVPKKILEAHMKVVEKTGMMASYIILPDHSESSEMEQLNDIRIPLQTIKNCTQDFNESNFIGKGGYGMVYKGNLSWGDHIDLPVAVKRLDVKGFQGKKEFLTEVTMLSQHRHENIITLVGYCDDSKEMILVYEYATNGSLDTYLSDPAMLGKLSWPQLLSICIGAASALDHLHNHVAEKHRIIHRDIKSANILLDENFNPKLSDFGLSRIGLANQQNSAVITNPAGTHGYCDPQYQRTGVLTKESDVYSFGVVLFEVLCGRLAFAGKYNDERKFLDHWARTCYKNGWLDHIIDHKIKEHIKPKTLKKFSSIAYQCLQETRVKRPAIAEVLLQLKEAMKIQVSSSSGRLRFLQDYFIEGIGMTSEIPPRLLQ